MKPFKEFIEGITSARAPGPSMTFGASHVFFAFELMATKTIGRNNLAKQLGVGEGTVRTIIGRLKSDGLITTSRQGCSLTEKGSAVWSKFEQLFPRRAEIGESEFTNAKHNYAFIVKNSGQNVRSGIEQRDAAVVAGAAGAVIIVAKQGHLTIESVSNRVEKRFPQATDQIQKALHPEDNDVVVLVGATSPLRAKHGAFAASWTLVGDDVRVSLA
jgi:predicted transcriptional regulator